MKVVAGNLPGKVTLNAEGALKVTVTDVPSEREHEIMNIPDLEKGVYNRAYLYDDHSSDIADVILEQNTATNQFILSVKGKSSGSFHVVNVVNDRNTAKANFDKLTDDIRKRNQSIILLLRSIVDTALIDAAMQSQSTLDAIINEVESHIGENVDPGWTMQEMSDEKKA